MIKTLILLGKKSYNLNIKQPHQYLNSGFILKNMITIKEAQDMIKEFDQARKWDGFYPLDIFANINEEVGEIWKKFAWQKEAGRKDEALKHKADLEDGIGDLFFLVLRLANQFEVDVERGLRSSLKDLKQRFPEKEE